MEYFRDLTEAELSFVSGGLLPQAVSRTTSKAIADDPPVNSCDSNDENDYSIDAPAVHPTTSGSEPEDLTVNSSTPAPSSTSEPEDLTVDPPVYVAATDHPALDFVNPQPGDINMPMNTVEPADDIHTAAQTIDAVQSVTQLNTNVADALSFTDLANATHTTTVTAPTYMTQADGTVTTTGMATFAATADADGHVTQVNLGTANPLAFNVNDTAEQVPTESAPVTTTLTLTPISGPTLPSAEVTATPDPIPTESAPVTTTLSLSDSGGSDEEYVSSHGDYMDGSFDGG